MEKGRDKDVVCIFLYGSLARGTATEESDVDMGIVCERPVT